MLTAVYSWRQKYGISMRAVALAGVLFVGIIAVESRQWREARAWHDSVRLPRHIAAAEQRSAFRTAHVYVTLGNDLLRQGNIQAAMEHYRLALKAQPDFLNARINLAFAYAAAGNNDKAIEEYLRVLELKRDEPMAHFNLGLLLVERGDPGKAAEHFRRALDINPSDDAARQELCKLVKNCSSEATKGR
jgi:tetratricopeptide (TPR) repeat protein